MVEPSKRRMYTGEIVVSMNSQQERIVEPSNDTTVESSNRRIVELYNGTIG